MACGLGFMSLWGNSFILQIFKDGLSFRLWEGPGIEMDLPVTQGSSGAVDAEGLSDDAA